MGKECRKTLLSTQYVKCGFTSGIVVYVVTCCLVVDGLRCNRCDGTIQEAGLAKYLVKKLTYSTHIHNIPTHKLLQIINALTTT